MTHKRAAIVTSFLAFSAILVPHVVIAAVYPFTAIPIEQCRLNGLGIYSWHELVIDTLGPADEEKNHAVVFPSTERPKMTLVYDGLYVALFRNRLMMIKDSGFGLTLPSGVAVGTSEADLIEAYGDVPKHIDDHRSYLAFVCVNADQDTSGILLQFLLVDGMVDNIVINKNF